MADASSLLIAAFAALAVLVAAFFPLGLFGAELRLGASRTVARRNAAIAALGTLLWMTATLLAAATGLLAFGPMPPPLGMLFLLILVGAFTLAFSRVGERLAMGLPLAVLVGVQGFRFPLELLMHRAYTEGVMPEQMSYSGLNFDIATGITALLVAGLLLTTRLPLWVVRAWNGLGTLLLVNILVIAWLSTPTPLRVFMNEPANVWVTTAPFVWLPCVLVFTALLGHLILFRRLRAEARGRVPAPSLQRRTVPRQHPVKR